MLAVSAQLGLDAHRIRRQPFNKLSGGQKQKLLISIALGRDCDLLVLDEPAANLDPEARHTFFQLLAARQTHVAMMISSHRLDEVAALVERPTDSNPLLLPAGQRTGRFKQFLLQPQTRNQRADRGRFPAARPDEIEQVVPGRVSMQTPHVDVVEHAQRRDQTRVLRHKRRPLLQSRLQRRKQGGFTRATLAHQGDSVSGLYGQGDIAQDRVTAVAKILADEFYEQAAINRST